MKQRDWAKDYTNLLAECDNWRNRAEAAEKREAALRDALAFYRDSWVSMPNMRYGGLEWRPTESLLDDCGNTARTALEVKP